MALFKKKVAKKKTIMASPPEEVESEEELLQAEHDEVVKAVKPKVQPQPQIVEVPMFLSQDQINNITIETHMMIKELMAMAKEE